MCKFAVDTKRGRDQGLCWKHSKILLLVAGGSLEGVGTVYISHKTSHSTQTSGFVPTQLRSHTRNYASNAVFEVLCGQIQFLQEEWLGPPQERQKGSFCRFDGTFSRFCSLLTATCSNGEIFVEAKVVFLRGESEAVKFYTAGWKKRLRRKTKRTKCIFRKHYFARLWYVWNGKSSKFSFREKNNRTIHNGRLVNLSRCRWSIHKWFPHQIHGHLLIRDRVAVNSH